MDSYESKQVVIRRPAEQIFKILSDFTNFTPIVKDKVQDWQADADSCSFSVKGFTLALRITGREPYTLLKIEVDRSCPFPFTFWFQFKQLAPDDTRMRLVLHVEMNGVMRLMLKGKIQKAMDEMADRLAQSFNMYV